MYKVIVKFTDLQDGNHAYGVGDEFPRTGTKVSKERLKELSTSANRRGFPLIKEVKAEAEEVEPEKKEKGRRKKDVGADSTGDKELLHP